MRAYCGVLYGVRVKGLSTLPIIMNISVSPLYVGEEGSESDLKFEYLSELLPVGVDPVGVVFISAFENDEREGKILGTLVDNLPDSETFVHDPIVAVKNGSSPVSFSVLTEGEFDKIAEIKAIDTKEVEQHTTTIRVKGKIELFASADERDILSWIRHTIEKAASPYGTFRLDKSDVFFLHTFAPAQRGKTGWTATDLFKEEYVEECNVSNIESLDPALSNKEIADTYTIDDLWSLVKSDEDDQDDGFGIVDPKKKTQKKKVIKKEQTMNFQMYMKMSGDACTSRTRNCAPVIHYEKFKGKVVKIPINLDGLAVADNAMKIVDVMELLKAATQRQIHIMGGSVLSEFKKLQSFSTPEVFHLKPEPFGHYVTVVYTKTGSCSTFAPFRLKLHRKFLLPADRPYFRRLNKVVFEQDKPTSGPLTNVHEGLAPSGVNGDVAIVHGNYAYHHYMQDKFDDDGWGCAYRSLQTLISWFRMQGYASTNIPSHSQIQKCLVDMGDKPKSFIDSRQWIGSTEVGYVLEKSCEVQCKFLNVSSGEELENKGRELAHHFKTNGTPIMIGMNLEIRVKKH